MKAKPTRSASRIILLSVLFCSPFFLHAQAVKNPDDSTKVLIKPTYIAKKVQKAPKIDGRLDDAIWQSAPLAGSMTQFEPKPFSPATLPTVAQIVYDNEAIYIAAHLTEDPKLLRRELSRRDGIFDANTDYFTVSFDTYDDDQNGFRFAVAASGTQADAKISTNNTDFSWDAVWESAVSVVADGWVLEMKIPYFNLRFPKKAEQKWGLQFARFVKRLGETDTWAPLDPKVNGQVIQWGNLEGMMNLEPPLRLQLSPYIAAEYQSIGSIDGDGKKFYGNSKSISGGLDLKLGLNEAFTLDATLIPNFGQVQSDNRILNLSPFELFFQERRPFFTEGTELFSKGDIFYSRRIGGTPRKKYDVYGDLNRNEVVEKNPNETQLYNATKVSGRTGSKLGVGILNAVAAPMYATIKDTMTGKQRTFQTGELTNYNVTVFDQLFKNNSSISFTNAATIRNGSGRDANVSALGMKFRDKNNKYEVSARGRMSHIFRDNKATESGYTYDVGVGKVSGNWTWSLNQELQDDKWNPSDLGYFQQRNYFFNAANISYNQYIPNKIFLQSNWWAGLYSFTRFKPFAYQEVNLNLGFWGKFQNQSWANYWMNVGPSTVDYFEPRAEGKKFVRPASYRGGLNVGTDDRKPLSSYFYFGVSRYLTDWDNTSYDFSVDPTVCINSHFRFNFQFAPTFAKNDYGYNFTSSDGTFGRRDLWFVNNSVGLNFNFNPKSNLSVRVRHYWSRVEYKEFFNLRDDGTLAKFDGTHANADISQNFFNVDFIYTWQFAPGSFFNFVWKNSLDSYASGQSDIASHNYAYNFRRTLDSPQNNGFTVKMIYFVDYNQARNALR